MSSVPAIGIDLGTTYSCVGVFQNGKVEIIANDQGNRITPSVVAFSDTDRLIGEFAKSQITKNPKNTVFDAKRLIGREFDDPVIQSDMRHWPFEVVDETGKPNIRVEYKGERKTFHPEEISSMVLTKMKETAENYLGKAVTRAVITVPAYFNDSQRQATRDAGKIAGLNVLRILNEPTAAAIAYGLDKRNEEDRNVLIFDLGGGTFDVSILKISRGIFEVKATAGDTHLGGEDFDARLVDYLAKQFKQKHNKDLTKNERALRRLKNACETAKRALSSSTVASIEIDAFLDGIDLDTSITRARFENLNDDLFQKTLQTVKKALSDANMDKSEIHDIVLVGGSTRIPKVQKLVQDFFSCKKLDRSINADEAVAYGAAVQAAIINGDESSEIQNLLLLDVIPLSLGVETKGGLMSVVIPRNTRIPVSRSQDFTTSIDNQTNVLFKVFEGERPLTKDNTLLGEYSVRGILPAPRGFPSIMHTIDVDANGILHVSSVDRGTKRKNEITITSNKQRLSEEEIERMLRDAEKYKEEDEKRKALVEARNALESYTFRVKSSADDNQFRDVISNDERVRLINKADETQQWIDSKAEATKEDYMRKQKELESMWNPLVEKIYSGRHDSGQTYKGPIIEEVD